MGNVHENIFEMRNVTKAFARVVANDDVNFSVRKGEIHALLGENGAGKSTLMNILYGLLKKDSGSVLWNGRELAISSPAEAIQAGIGMIHQHFQLVGKFTVLENIVLGRKEGRWIELRLDAAEKRVMELSEIYGLNIRPRAVVENLTVGEQQRVEILKMLYRESNLLIMDEPTAVLTPQEVVKLFKTLRKLKTEGKSIIFISHKLPEVLEISDRISVMRDGKMIVTFDVTPDLNTKKLAGCMVGREINLQIEKSEKMPGVPLLSLKNACADPVAGSSGVRNITLDVRRGEIVGLAGVDGNGQTDLSELIMGLRKLTKGSIVFEGADISNCGVGYMRCLPVGYIPADRTRAALVMDLSVQLNMAINKPDKPPFGSRFMLNFKAIAQNAAEKARRFNVSLSGPDELAKNLSGGNQQKVVLAKEVGDKVDLIIAVYPTRGLDIDATRFVFETMLKARDAGVAVLYISTELEEILALSDRIGVLYEGALVDVMPGKGAEIEKIGLMMAGARV
jgi:simple sugar transport system ATP-binding protein